MPKISVMLCAYNSGKTIRKAVDCLINQTFRDLEIILVNDGSTDDTLNIMQEYQQADSRVKVVSHENMGHGLARNTGLAVATGEYLAFLDSDDTLTLNALEMMYEKAGRGKYDIVVCNHNKIFANKIRRNVREVTNETINLNQYGRKKYIEKYLMSYRHEMGVFNKLIRLSLFKNNGIYFSSNHEMLYDDVLPVLELACVANTIVAVDDAYYNYDIHEGALCDMQNTASRMPYTFPKLVESFRIFAQGYLSSKDLDELMPMYYYSQVYFGLIRAKRFGHADISGASSVLSTFDHYHTYMAGMGRFPLRLRFVTQVASGLSLRKSFPMIGLCWLTLIQGGFVSRYASRGQFDKIDQIL